MSPPLANVCFGGCRGGGGGGGGLVDPNSLGTFERLGMCKQPKQRRLTALFVFEGKSDKIPEAVMGLELQNTCIYIEKGRVGRGLKHRNHHPTCRVPSCRYSWVEHASSAGMLLTL